MEMEKYRKKICTMLDQLFEKPDLTPMELKNASDAFELLEKMNKVERGDAMRDEFEKGSYGANSWVASGPYPDYGYGDNYGRQMRSSRTGRYMNNDTGVYGHSLKDRMVANLEDMMDSAHSDYERKYLMNKIQELRKDDTM